MWRCWLPFFTSTTVELRLLMEFNCIVWTYNLFIKSSMNYSYQHQNAFLGFLHVFFLLVLGQGAGTLQSSSYSSWRTRGQWRHYLGGQAREQPRTSMKWIVAVGQRFSPRFDHSRWKSVCTFIYTAKHMLSTCHWLCSWTSVRWNNDLGDEGWSYILFLCSTWICCAWARQYQCSPTGSIVI